MEAYANRHGGSGVQAYEIGDDRIRVRFLDGAVYLYTYASAGAENIEHMKALARQGRGLNTFINTRVYEDYAARER